MAKNIVGQFIPNIFINRITVESGGHVPRPYDDPHVTEFSVPTPTTGDSHIKVTIDLSIKEYLFSDGFTTTWFDDFDAHKYFQIMIFESRDPLVTKAIATAPQAAATMLGLTNNGQAGTAAVMNSVKLGVIGISENKVVNNNNVKAELDKTYQANTCKRLIPFADIQVINEGLKNNYKTVLDDGTVIYSIPHTVTFENIPGNSLNLSYFATVVVDADALEKEFNLGKIDTPPYGNIVGEIVFENGATASKSYGFFDLNGNPWVGPSHTHEGKLMTDVTQGPGSKEIVKKYIVNSKVQDFRHVEMVKKLQLNLSVIENKVLLAKSKIKSLAFDVIGKKNTYFSDCFISRDSENNARFLFAFDFRTYIKDNSVFGKLYDSDVNNIFPGLLDEIVRIKSFKLIRRRVQDTWSLNKTANYVSRNTVFDKNKPYFLLAITSDTKTPAVDGSFKLVSVDGARGGIAEIKIFDSFKTTTVAGSNAGTRYFSGMDKTAFASPGGLYQYGIELEIEDRTAAVIQNLFITALRNTLTGESGLRWYLNEAAKSGRVVSVQWGAQASSVGTMKENTNFDIASNRFTQKFIKQMASKFGSDTGGDTLTPWANAVQVYISFLKLFLGKPAEKIADSLTLPLVAHASPHHGNPRGIMNLIKLIEDLISVISSMAGMNKNKLKEFSSTTAGNVNLHSHTPRVSKIEHFFRSVFDTNVSYKVGFDYLSTTGLLQGELGVKLKTITESEYKNRTALERMNLTSGVNVNSMMKISGFLQDFLTDTVTSHLSLSSVNLGPGFFYDLVPFAMAKSILSSKPSGASSKNADDEDIPFSQMMAEVIAYNQNKTIFRESPESSHLMSKLPPSDSRLAATLETIFGANQRTMPGASVVVSSGRDAARDPGTRESLLDFRGRRAFSRDHSREDTEDFKKSLVNPGDHSIYDINPNRFLLRLIALEDFSLSKHNAGMKYFNGWLTTAADTIKQLVQKQHGSFGMKNLSDSVLTKKFTTAPIKLRQLIASAMTMTDLKNQEGLSLQVTPEGLSSDPMHFAALIFKYGHIKKIEVFAGFRRSTNGTAIVSSPVWIPLTIGTLEDLPGGKNVFCRIRDYDFREHTGGAASPLKPPEIMNLPIYNEYFLIQASSLKSVITSQSKSMFMKTTGAVKTKIMNASTIINAASEGEFYQSIIIGGGENADASPPGESGASPTGGGPGGGPQPTAPMGGSKTTGGGGGTY